jgi:hypothetical protein
MKSSRSEKGCKKRVLGETGVGKAGPTYGAIAEIQADEIAAVLGLPAVNDLRAGSHRAHEGSDFHLFARLPRVPGGDASSMRADIVRVGLFLLVGLMLGVGELNDNYNWETLLVSTFETAIEKHDFWTAVVHRSSRWAG